MGSRSGAERARERAPTTLASGPASTAQPQQRGREAAAPLSIDSLMLLYKKVRANVTKLGHVPLPEILMKPSQNGDDYYDFILESGDKKRCFIWCKTYGRA
jgi:hypothetical protein